MKPNERKRQTGGHPTAARANGITSAVITATVSAFAERGADFSMDQVASMAGVSKQAIYRRWKTKESLLAESIDSLLVMELDTATDGRGDAVAILRTQAWRHFDRDLAANHRISVFLLHLALHNDHIRSRLVTWQEAFKKSYVRLLEAVDRQGNRLDGDVEQQAEAIYDILEGGLRKLATMTGVTEADKASAFEGRWALFLRIAIRQPDATAAGA